MALTAVRTESTRVYIVAAMAAPAGRIELNSVGNRSQMTGFTLQSAMSAVESEVSFTIVVELPNQPVVRVVASFTSRPEALFVNVILDVTVHALIVSIMEGGACVTSFAPDRRMQPEQRERRQIVVEANGIIPCSFAMACLTGFTELSPMRVVVGVATDAAGIR